MQWNIIGHEKECSSHTSMDESLPTPQILCSVKSQTPGSQMLCFHLYEMFTMDKSIETEQVGGCQEVGVGANGE